MKKYILIILVLLVGVGLFVYLHPTTVVNENPQIQQDKTEQIKNISTNKNKDTEKERPNKICNWIEKSDIIIKLDLPEEYAKANSYGAGFLFKSSYGDQARLVRLARKDCDYKVGFSKKDFTELNMAPSSPFVIIAEKDSSKHFSYENWPINISFDKNGTITNGMPENGKTIIIKINGEVNAFEQYKIVQNN